MNKDEKNISPEEYNNILGGVNFSKIYLQSGSGKLKGRNVDLARIKVNIKEGYDYKIISPEEFIIYFEIILTGKLAKKNIIEISSCFAVEFKTIEKPSDAFLEIFKKNVDEIKKLLARGILKTEGKGRSVHYILV